MKSTRLLSILVTLVIVLGSLPIVPIAADSPPPLQPIVRTDIKHDISPPLRSIPPIPPQAGPVREIPLLHRPPTGPDYDEGRDLSFDDPIRQLDVPLDNMPAPILNFEGVDNVNGVHPPDTQGDVGPDHYVQWVNLSFAIWDKQGNLLYGPANGNTLWSGFGGVCETSNDGDPITLYDPLADRWLMSQFALPNFPYGPFYQCLAISQTPDPTGAWYRYQFLISTDKMNDYPHFGVWPDGYYMSINQFSSGSLSWAGAGVVAFERDQMLQGGTAQMVYFDLYTVNYNYGGMLPADMDGLTPPPANSPNYFAEVDDGSPDTLSIWEFHVDWNNTSNSTFGIGGNPNAVLNIAPFTPICPGSWNCIPQPDVSQELDAIGDRLMYRLAYRNFGDHESLVVNHTVDAGGGRAGVRWYEIRNPAAPVIYQQGTFAPSDGLYRWMGSVAMDHVGNIALGYSVSSNTVYPSIRYTGRLADDPLGTMPQGEATIINGSGSQTSSYGRWGDYSMLTVDPVDDCTFWYTTEYIETTGYAPWQTRIASFRFPNCQLTTEGTLAGHVADDSTGADIAGARIRATASPTLTFETTSTPDGDYALVLEQGTYTVTASAYGYLPFETAGVNIAAAATTTLDINLTQAPQYVVSGHVTDSRTGWPLYSQIDIEGYRGGRIWNDPATGFYSVTLYGMAPYTFTVQPWADGYLPATRSFTSLTGDTTADFAPNADLTTCDAPGYERIGGVCTAPTDGGLVVGNVRDGYTSDPLTRANIVNDAGYAAVADVTLDPAVDDAFFTIFSPFGTHTFTATQYHYGPAVLSVTIPSGSGSLPTVYQDFDLPSGRLSYTPAALTVTIPWEGYATRPLTLTNNGEVPVTFSLVELAQSAAQRSPAADLPWLRTSPTSGTLDAQATQVVDVIFDGAVLSMPDWGLHYAGLEIAHDTPYSVPNLPLTLTVVPPPPLLTVTQTPAADQAGIGLALAYTVTIGNAAGPASGVVLSVTLPTDTAFSGADSGGQLDGDTIVWRDLTVAGLGSTAVHYTVTVGCVSPGDTILAADYQVTATEWPTPVLGLPVSTTAVVKAVAADFGYSDLLLRDYPVRFTNRSQNGLTYRWDFGDGITSTLPAPTHTYGSAGDYLVSLTAYNLCGDSDTHSATISIEDYAPALAPADETRYADPGAVVTYTFTLTNAGTLSDLVHLTMSGPQWATALSTDTVGPLQPGETATFAVVVAVPADGMAYERDGFVVTATSALDPRDPPVAAVGVVTTIVNAIYEADLTPATAARSAYPGDTAAYRFYLVNNGNINDTYTATYAYLSGSNWPVAVSPAGPFTLAPGASQAVDVQVTVPLTATTVEQAAVALRLTSSGGVEATGVMTTGVKCVPVSGPSFRYAPAEPLSNLPVTLTAGVWLGTPPYSYTWNFADGSTLTSVSNANENVQFTHVFTTPGDYRVVLTVLNCFGTAASNAAHVLSVGQGPEIPTSHTAYLPLVLRTW